MVQKLFLTLQCCIAHRRPLLYELNRVLTLPEYVRKEHKRTMIIYYLEEGVLRENTTILCVRSQKPALPLRCSITAVPTKGLSKW
jgi:hypothetical protein